MSVWCVNASVVGFAVGGRSGRHAKQLRNAAAVRIIHRYTLLLLLPLYAAVRSSSEWR